MSGLMAHGSDGCFCKMKKHSNSRALDLPCFIVKGKTCQLIDTCVCCNCDSNSINHLIEIELKKLAKRKEVQ